MPDLTRPGAVVHLLARKRDGEALAPDDIAALVAAYTAGRVPDYQMAAFLMAGFVQGFTDAEAVALMRAMLHSGEVLDLSDVPGRKVDKHSTGGVGDKVSIVLAPLVAACGVPVPMISGRGLGHTGGTLDKLEAIPGFDVNLDLQRYREVLADVGTVMIGQTAEIAPADKKLYALRDVTATVESIPLIAASILSKKLAEGIDALVLDVKSGRGAFMTDEAEARRLAETLVRVATEAGTPCVALLTDMDVPLGRAVGNGPETAEAIMILRGETPDGGPCDDVTRVTLALAGEMLCLGGKAETPGEGVEVARRALASGAALGVFRRLVAAHGGDEAVTETPSRMTGTPVGTVEAQASGVLTDVDARAVAMAALALGAGRSRKEDTVDGKAGVVLNKRPGEPVGAGETLATLYASDASKADPEAVRRAFTIGQSVPEPRPLILDRLGAAGWRGA